MKIPLYLLLLSSVQASGGIYGYGCSSSGPRAPINIDTDEELTKEALESPYLLMGLDSLSRDRQAVSGNSMAFFNFNETPTNTRRREVIDLVSGVNESDESLAKKDATDEILNLVAKAPAPVAVQEEAMDIQTLSVAMSTFSEEKLGAKFRALGDGVKASLKENCNWTLLHEAVYSDCVPAARVLLRDFGFNPNAFDPYFGSAMYLVQSRAMAELLREYRGNLMDQRPCLMYQTALESSRVRRRLAVVSMVEKFQTRYGNMLTDFRIAQANAAELKFEATRENMFAVALAQVSRRRAGCAKADVFIDFRDEEAIDLGGVTREFIQMIKDRIVNDQRVVKSDENGRLSLIPDPEPETSSNEQRLNHDNELKLLGYIVGLSVYHKVPLKIEFQPIIYYVLSGLNPRRDVTDWIGMLKETDRIFWNSLFIVADFSEDQREGYTFPEIKGDSNRPWKRVRTEIKSAEDVKEFLTISAKKFVYLQYEKALSTFKSGFDMAVHSHLIAGYVTPSELKDAMVGETDYTAAQWKSACQAPTHEARYNEMFQWFWEIIDEFTREQRAALLKYVTALVSLPLGGFRALEKQPTVLIIDEIARIDFLPKASTCFNQIRMYPVSSKEKLRDLLIKAPIFGGEGFGDR